MPIGFTEASERGSIQSKAAVSNAMTILVIFATFLPIAYYVYVGVRKESRPTDLDDYFIYGRTVKANDFANTAVGYSLQTAALFLFADWGIRYGFGAFWVALFWGIGFFLLYALIPKLSPFLAKGWTLHGFLNAKSSSRNLQVIAAIATLIGLWGTMMVELDYATSLYQPLLGSDLNIYLLRALFLIFSLIYIGYGGYKAEVNTERVQLPVAYVTFLLVIFILVTGIAFSGYHTVFLELAAVLAVLFIFMIAAKVNVSGKSLFATPQALIPVFGLLGVASLIAYFHFHTGIAAATVQPLTLTKGLFAQLKGPGILALISLFLSNALWQFVDISSWQRVASVDIAGNDDERFKQMRNGLWRTMIESPVSWGFGVVFGMALRYGGFLPAGHDPSEAITNFATTISSHPSVFPFLGSLSFLVYPLFLSAIVAVMLSTINALSSAITFTAFRDLPPFAKNSSLKLARLYTAGIILFGSVAYFFLRQIVGVGIQTALYAFYSSQLALFPTVLAALISKKGVVGYAAISSILIGIVATFATSIWIARVAPDQYLLPPLVTFVVSCSAYAVLTGFAKRSVPSLG